MNPADSGPSAQTQNKDIKLHPMVVLQPGERVICEIKRHPFGIISVYAAAFVALAVAGSLAIAMPNFVDEYSFGGNMSLFLTAALVLFTVMIGLILVVATTVYWQNRWIVTDDSITQITQVSLFARQVSQLSMESLEDVSVRQHGILPTLFNFGTLKAETANEHTKFVFSYCPQPNKYARLISEIHETFLHQRRHQPQPVHPIAPLNGPHVGQPAQYQGMPPQQPYRPYDDAGQQNAQQQPAQQYHQPYYGQQPADLPPAPLPGQANGQYPTPQPQQRTNLPPSIQ